MSSDGTRVHFHTDNYWFSGSETTLLAILADAFEPGRPPAVFTYRAWPEYEEGLRARLDPAVGARPLRLPDPAAFKAVLAAGRGPAASLAARAAGRVLPLAPACFTADVARLGRLFHQERPRLVHVNNGGFPGAISCNAAAVAGWRAGIPVVYVVNNLAYGYDGLRRLAGWPQDRLVRRAVSRFVTGSKAAAGALAGVLSLDPSEVEVIPNTIVEGAPDETPAATRQRLGLPEHGPVLVTGARLETRKGHVHLVEAVRRLPAERREGLSVVFAGQGPERASIERAIAGAGLGDTVRLVGNQRNMWDLYALADVVVLPSIGHEDFPIVILEAMGAGRAVVASRVAGVPEQVVDGVTGLVVSPADPPALAGALESLLRDADRRRAMGDAGRLRYLDNYTPATVVGRYRALHDRLIEQGASQWA